MSMTLEKALDILNRAEIMVLNHPPKQFLEAGHLAIKALEDLVKEEKKSRWIPVTEQLPESNKAVLISARCKTFGFRHTLKAAHIGHHEATTEDYGWQEYEGDTEYDEEKDCFWIPECWWEDNFADGNSNWIIDSDCEVTHWMPLPELPKEVHHG